MQRIVLATILSLLVAGCGPQPERVPVSAGTTTPAPAGSPAADGSATATAGDSAGTSSKTESDEPTPDAEDDSGTTVVAVRGLPVGPASPDTPAPFRWYASLQDGQCGGLADTATASNIPEPERAMFAALAQVCRVLEGEGSEVDWDRARASFDDTSGVTDCLVVAARQLLADAVSAHDADPDAVLTPGPPAPGTACPVAIDTVELVRPTEIVVTGPYLFDPRVARLGSAALQVGSPEVEVDSGVPLVRVSLEGSEGFCLPAGSRSTLELSGDGYAVTAEFDAVDVGQGGCDQGTGGAATLKDEPTPAGS